jgi:hypothetical protein
MNARTNDEAFEAAWKIIEQGRNLARLHPLLDHLQPVDICERVYWMGLLTLVAAITEIRDDAERLSVWGKVMAHIAERGAEINTSMLDEIAKLSKQPNDGKAAH